MAKIKMFDFRGIFQREVLPSLVFENIDLYFNAIYEDNVDALIKLLWEEMIKAYDREPENYPIEFTVDTYNYDDNTCFTIIQMPELSNAKGKNIAIYAMIIFDAENRKKPRFFLGETDYFFSRTIFVAEWTWQAVHSEWQVVHNNWGPLPAGNDIMQPVEKENELVEFIERVAAIYLS